MKPNELETFFVMDTETTGFRPENADIIQVSAIKVKNVDGEFKVVGEFDSYINPEYPLPPDIVEFNKREQTGIDDELLSKAPVAKEVAPKLRDFLGTNPVIVLHNAPFDLKFLNKLYYNNLGCNLETGAVVDTLALSRDHICSAHYKLGNMFELSEKKYSNQKYSGTDLNFHTSLADSYATLDVLYHIYKTYYQQEKIAPQFEELGETRPDNYFSKQNIISKIKNAGSVENLAVIMCDKNISSIVVGLHEGNYTIDCSRIEISFLSEDKDLTDYAINLPRGMAKGNVGEKRCDAFIITRKPEKDGKPETFEFSGYVKKGKSDSVSVGFGTFGEIKYKDDIIDMRCEILNCVDEMVNYNKMMQAKKEKKATLER